MYISISGFGPSDVHPPWSRAPPPHPPAPPCTPCVPRHPRRPLASRGNPRHTTLAPAPTTAMTPEPTVGGLSTRGFISYCCGPRCGLATVRKTKLCPPLL